LADIFMKEKFAKKLAEQVKDDYNLTVDDYTRSRSFIPEDIKNLADYAGDGDRILDAGCANGRLYGVFSGKKIDYFGIDISDKMIERAKRDYPEGKFQIADGRSLPFPDNYFDKVYSISVIHNIPSKKFRRRYLEEAVRVLRPGGLLILRVWDFWSRKIMPKLFLKAFSQKLFSKNRADLFDVFVPWKDSRGQVITERYFHCFTKRELKKVIREAGFKVEKSWRAGRDPRTNIYAIACKPVSE